MLCRTHHQGSKSIWKDNSLVRYILLQIRTTFNWPVKHNVIVALCTYVCAFSHKTWLNLFFVCVPSHPLKLYSLSWWPRCINGFSVGFHSLLHNATLVSMTAINKTMVKRREKRKVSSIGWRCCPTKKKKKSMNNGTVILFSMMVYLVYGLCINTRMIYMVLWHWWLQAHRKNNFLFIPKQLDDKGHPKWMFASFFLAWYTQKTQHTIAKCPFLSTIDKFVF